MNERLKVERRQGIACHQEIFGSRPVRVAEYLSVVFP
jgi:hypothetical protein